MTLSTWSSALQVGLAAGSEEAEHIHPR
jgi:hypothetical protein